MILASFSPADIGESLEGLMIFCFGISWPFAIYRTWKAKKVEGKSLIFLSLVFAGYLAGVVSKLAKAYTWADVEKIIILYAINAVLVAIDLCLYLRYRKRSAPLPSPAGPPASPPVE